MKQQHSCVNPLFMISIEFENISKQYRLGLVSTRTLSHDLNRWWQTAVLRREDPYLKIGETNDRSTHGTSDYVWALRDISFKVEQGDVVGIIGKNGAGKSTLLKLLSKVTSPTTGTIRARGRIASLLEVGTGFHGEMTGRENIYLNGAIMGMTKQEIDRKLDEIVDFSGCERYIDTPVKRYSSGMTVRLGFAVAAHLDPEILVVDEVLAVGDAEFQKKAIGKMQDISHGEGRTVLFVSHNMGSVARLCTKGIVLNKGEVVHSGTSRTAIDYYLNIDSIKSSIYKASSYKDIQVLEAKIMNEIEKNQSQFSTSQKILVSVLVNNGGSRTVRGNFSIENCIDQGIIVERFDIPTGKHEFIFEFNANNLLAGSYSITFALDTYGVALYEILHHMLTFDIVDTGTQYSVNRDTDNGLVSSFVKSEMIR